MQLVAETYTTERVKDSDYYKKTKDYLNYLDLLFEGEKSKSEVKKIFRNIHNTSVIPVPVYEEHRTTIDGLVDILHQKNPKDATKEEREKLQRQKKEARAQLSAFKVDLPDYVLEWEMFDSSLKISRYEEIKLLKCSYSKELGVTLEKPEKEDVFF